MWNYSGGYFFFKSRNRTRSVQAQASQTLAGEVLSSTPQVEELLKIEGSLEGESSFL